MNWIGLIYPPGSQEVLEPFPALIGNTLDRSPVRHRADTQTYKLTSQKVVTCDRNVPNSTNNSCKSIWLGLDKFLDAFPGGLLSVPGRPTGFREDSNLGIMRASPDVWMLLNVHHTSQSHLQPCECETCHLEIGRAHV